LPLDFTPNVSLNSNDTSSLIETLKHKLASWAINFNIPRNALNELLLILKKVPGLTELPKDSRSVLRTRKINETSNLTMVDPGVYHHFGLSLAIRRHFNLTPINNVDLVRIVVGIDGLPISKSSSSQFWPILGYIRPLNNVFPIGIYWGHEKPKCSNDYLEQFIIEARELLLNGININSTIIKVQIDGFCLDAPAKSFVLKIKGHSGFDSCTRCTEEGEYLKKRTCFPLTPASLVKRTHNDYITRKYDEHHVGSSISNLCNLPNINIVTHFALDYMHLTCLGVMKKLIILWIDKGPLSVRIPSLVCKELSALLLSLKPFIPCEFARKPRGLNELCRFKATELRQLLIYTGQICFKNYLSEDCYKHFMTLSISMRILLSNDFTNYVDYAQELLNYFVVNFELLYGKHFVSHNVHALTHIVDDYKHFGTLDNISAFPFENYMKTLKKMVRKHELPLQQVIKRHHEQIDCNIDDTNKNKTNVPICKNEHSKGPLLEDLTGSQYKTLYLDNFTIKTNNIADCYVLCKNNNIYQVKNIVNVDDMDKIVILGNIFLSKKPFYETPINSNIFNIYEVDNLSDELTLINLDEIKRKTMLVKFNDGQKISVPLLHSHNC